ncbi:MAG: 2Fe-2S iron-sulfur cluster-binding protein [Candidatus Moduliflexus flocculans]|nr:2Fe-2S iron-sulfur cluster-binding protein [Candidatus Moduliflexus flocculans]
MTIDNRQVEATAGATILEAARSVGIKIPTLCAWTEINHTPGACRVCMTEVEGQRSLIAACVFPVSEGMVVQHQHGKSPSGQKDGRGTASGQSSAGMQLSASETAAANCRKWPNLSASKKSVSITPNSRRKK